MNKVIVIILLLTAAILLHSPRARADLSGRIDTIEVVEAPVSNPHEEHRERARLANVQAANEAADAVAASVLLELDFSLPGHTSLLIAGNR